MDEWNGGEAAAVVVGDDATELGWVEAHGLEVTPHCQALTRHLCCCCCGGCERPK